MVLPKGPVGEIVFIPGDGAKIMGHLRTPQ